MNPSTNDKSFPISFKAPSAAPARLAIGALAFLGASIGVTQPAHAQSIEVRVDLYSLLCDETTAEPYSDEPFMVGSWANLQTKASGTIHQPPPFQYWYGSLGWLWVYPHWGDVDANEFPLFGNTPVWQGWIQNGQTVAVPLAFWEKDSNYEPDEYAEDMVKILVQNAPSLLLGGSVSYQDMAKMVFLSAKFLFGAGASDPLGFFSVRLTNVNGKLQKQVIAGDYTHFGTAYCKQATWAYAWDSNKISYLKALGWKQTSKTFTQVFFTKTFSYGPLDAKKQTLRLVLDGAGQERYQAGIQVRLGPFGSSQPNGAVQTWTVDSSVTAH